MGSVGRCFLLLLTAVLLAGSMRFPVFAEEADANTGRSRAMTAKKTAEEEAGDLPEDAWQVIRTSSEVCCGEDASCIFIGDSRTVSMSAFVRSNDYIWSAKDGANLSWMEKVGTPRVEEKITQGSNVVILMGFNDLFFADKPPLYADYLNEKAAAWKEAGARTFFVSVNPITQPSVAGGRITNEKIKEWNTELQECLSKDVIYLDTYAMVDGLFTSKDGIHYEESEYQTLYDLILDLISEVEDEARREAEALESFVPQITSAVRGKDGAVTIAISKPEGVRTVFYEVQTYDTYAHEWVPGIRVKTTTVSFPAEEGDVRMRARAYKSYRSGIAYSGWSDELVLDESGAVKKEKELPWIRFTNWLKGLFQ